VKHANENPIGSEKRRQAIWGIRDIAEKRKNPGELVQLGVIPIMVATLRESKAEDEKLWTLWVLRYLADYEEAAPLILQEPMAIEGLVSAILEANVGSEAARRAVECVEHLSKHLSTQILLAREDMLTALGAAFAAAPAEGAAAMHVYYSLSEAETGGSPPYISVMKKPRTLENLKKLIDNPKLAAADKEKAEKLYSHLST